MASPLAIEATLVRTISFGRVLTGLLGNKVSIGSANTKIASFDISKGDAIMS
jgi:hypothetical protein